MGSSQSKVKPKPKTPDPGHHEAGGNGTASQALTSVPSLQLSSFYAAGPLLSLGAPIQAKLVVGQPGDAYEREADTVADRVTAGQAAPLISTIAPGSLGGAVLRQKEEESAQTFVQRQEKEPEEEEEPTQTFIQRQEEEPEKEEEPVQAFIQRQEEEPEEEPVQTFIQRQEEEPEEEEEPAQTFVQRQEEEPEEEPAQTLIQRQEEEPEEEEEEEPTQTSVQRQVEEPEEEPAQAFVQRQEEEPQEEEEPVQTFIQRQVEEPEEEPDQAFVQRQEEEPQEEEEPVQAFIQRQEEEPQEEEEPAQTFIQRQVEEPEEEPVQAKRAATSGLNRRLTPVQSGGTPLSETVRAQMEPQFGADLSGVRVHTDAAAAQMNREMRSQAFTSGSHIYFGAGRYNPGNGAGRRLIAHELTHVVQQGAARGASAATIQHSPKIVQRSWLSSAWGAVSGAVSGAIDFVAEGLEAGKRALTSHLRDFVSRIPGYRLFTVVLGRDPITGDAVARNGRNFIEAGLDVIPNGRALKTKLEQEGALAEAAAWLDGQIELLDFSPSEIIDQFRRFWNSLRLSDLASPRSVFQRVRNIFQPPISRLFRFARNVAVRLLEIVKNYVLSQLVEFVRQRTRAYPLVRVIAGQDPITGESVERSPINLLRAFMQLSEAGAEKLRQMEETGTLQRAANWIGGAIARLTRNVRAIRNGFVRLWRSVTIQNLLNPIRTFSEIYQTFAEPVGDILSFLVEVGAQVLRFIKDALLSRLSAFARTLPGYPLLTVILGRDPFTSQDVPRTATNFVRGFLSLLPNGEERFRNLQESGALDRAFAWLGSEVEKLDLSWASIRELFLTAWRSLSIRDLANPIAAFRRMVNLFREPVGRILRFAGAVGMKILEFVFEGVMGAGGTRVLNILKRARDTFLTIIRNPVGFLSNLINAVVQGFRQFAANILRHLASGLVGWLFGALEGAGLQLPERFDLRGIISLVLQILGLTYDRIRPRLVRLLGERTVSILERTFAFLRILVTEGPAGAWRKIVEFAGNLRDQVMEGIRNWVITRVVTAAVMRLATMFNPVGAVLQAILAIYNAVMFFIERINQIMALVESITESIANIAAGNISAAANYVEQTMARTLPLIISFLARLLGLGNISGAIRRIIERIRRPIDRAIDRVVQWIVRQARRLVRRARSAVWGQRVDPQAARQAADRAANELKRVARTPRSPDTLRREKEQLARQLERRYSAQLGRGGRMRIQLAQPRSGQGVPYTISVQPGRVRQTGTIPTDSRSGGPGQMAPITLRFAMAGQAHTLTLKEQQGQLAVTMASNHEIPLTTKFQSLYTELDDWRHFLDRIRPNVAPNIQRQIDAKINHLRNIRATQTTRYNDVYNRTFGSRRGDEGHQDPNRERAAMRQLRQMAEQDLITIRQWAEQTGTPGLAPTAVRHTLRQLGAETYRAALADRRQRVDRILANFRTRNGRPVRYRGSLATGQRGPHKAGIRFNPDRFDIDLFVVDPQEHAQVLLDRPNLRDPQDPNAPIRARRAGGHILTLEQQVVAALEAQGAVPGIRVGESYILLRNTEPR